MSRSNDEMETSNTKNILLVEDEAIIALMESEVLKRYGFKVITVHSAVKAIEAVKNGGIDLILMDIDLGLGKMDGTEAAEIILKENELPVIFLTSHTEKDIVKKVKGITRYGYVVKNSGEFILVETITMAFDLFEAHQAIVRENTYQNRLRAQLVEKDALFSTFLKNSPIYVFFKDSEIRSLMLSKNYEELFNMPLDDLIGKTMDDLFPSDLAKSMIEDDKKILNEGKVIQVDEEFNGRYYSTTKFPIEIDGKPRMLAGVTIDITENRQIRQELLESEQRFRYILKYDPSAIAVYDKDLHYIIASDRYLQDYGVKESDIVGKHHYEVFPEIPERWREIHRRVLQGEILRNDNDHFIREDGSITYNRWECRPWYNTNGEIGGMITYTEVITDQIKAEQHKDSG